MLICDFRPQYPLCSHLVAFYFYFIIFMIILTWNAQGASSTSFVQTLLNHIKDTKPNIITLLKPRISGVRADYLCGRIGYDGIIRMEAEGFSGGIWLL